MLTVVDRPVIQYVVDEAREAGIEHFIFVTGRNKAVIEDHFDVQFELYSTRWPSAARPSSSNEPAEAAAGRRAQTSFTRQQVPMGLGHAVWCARELVGDEPFALLLPDMIMQSEKSCMPTWSSSIIRARPATTSSPCRNAILPKLTNTVSSARARISRHTASRMTEMVEKPAKGHRTFQPLHQWPLHPAAGDFQHPGSQERGAGNEIQLTDAMLKLTKDAVLLRLPLSAAVPSIAARRKAFVEANVAFALWRNDIRNGVIDNIGNMLKTIQPRKD
jgi:UTP--glucose-1-phosphate uridylyltransferase